MVGRPAGPTLWLKDESRPADMTRRRDRQPRRDECRGARCGGTGDVTNQPAPDARPSSLHRRLTVALASPADRARLAEVIAGDLGAIGVDGSSPLVRSEDVWLAADGFAQARAADRTALRTRLDAVAARAMHDCDTARHQLEHLLGWRRTLLEGVDWATLLQADLPEHLGAVAAARDALDERRIEQRAAQQDLARVLEQRSAAGVAIEEADRELTEMSGTGMDESALRRELEAAGQAVQDAQQVQDTALARLGELQIEATGLEVRREAAQPTDAVTVVRDGAEVTAITAVRDALGNLQSVMIDGEVDPRAVALADAWAELSDDLAQLGGPLEGPSDAELEEVRRRVDAAVGKLAELDAATAASALTPDQRAALDAAHAAMLTADERTGRRRGAAAAQKKLEQAQAAERALLDQHGFGGYLDVVLTGGRAAAAHPTRTIAEREHFEATLALEALERAGRVSPDLTYLRSERARLLEHVTELLGVDPGNEVLPLLRSHRPVSRELQAPLVSAFAGVGLHPLGVSLEAAAIAFLEAHPLPEENEVGNAVPDNGRHIEVAAIEARSAALEGELDAAQAEVDRAAETLQMAGRSVGAFESELSVRVGEDLTRMKRFAAVEQLRAQIDAVAATLRRAEEDAGQAVAGADQVLAAAGVAFDQAAAEVSDLARRTRKLAEELPIDQRPEGDPLQSLPVLAERLQGHSTVLQPEIGEAEEAVASASIQLEEALAASRLAGAGKDGPLVEDLVEGLRQILGAEPGDTLLVLDEPFVGVGHEARAELLEVVRHGAAARQLVLLTEDAEVLGWAIELPIEEATAMPADALLARMRRSNQGLTSTPATATSAPESIDITTSTTDPDPEPAPTARRRAGQR